MIKNKEIITLHGEDREVIVEVGSLAEDHYRSQGFADKKSEPQTTKPARKPRTTRKKASDEVTGDE